jgi:L-lactate utilization protein LutB
MVEILKSKAYDTYYAEDLDEAKKLVLDMIPHGSSVAVGGSETLGAMGLVDIFRGPEYKFFERYKTPWPETIEVYRQSMLADFLVTGTNAITRNGELVNVDSSGNRAAGIVFGPKRVIIVAGANKVVDNLEDALKRLKKIAPMNALRNNHKTPCIETGRCMDCNVPQRMCNSITIVNHGMKFEGRISIIMVAEEAGF